MMKNGDTEMSNNLDLNLYSGVSGEAYFEEGLNTELVLISNIHFDALYQARLGVNNTQVKNYANAMKNGAKFSPVRLAKIEGKKSLTVIDGWHRLKAIMLLGVAVTPAIIEPMSAKDALWYASLANLGHGLAVKPTEVRRAFRMFVKSGRHRKGKEFMSYRELSATLNGRAAHSTIANWMKKDFPKIARAMGGMEHGNSLATNPRVDFQAGYSRQGNEALVRTLVNYKELSCPVARYALYEQASNMVAVMGEYTMDKPEF